jgi:hypothetical protein
LKIITGRVVVQHEWKGRGCISINPTFGKVLPAETMGVCGQAEHVRKIQAIIELEMLASRGRETGRMKIQRERKYFGTIIIVRENGQTIIKSDFRERGDKIRTVKAERIFNETPNAILIKTSGATVGEQVDSAMTIVLDGNDKTIARMKDKLREM